MALDLRTTRRRAMSEVSPEPARRSRRRPVVVTALVVATLAAFATVAAPSHGIEVESGRTDPRPVILAVVDGVLAWTEGDEGPVAAEAAPAEEGPLEVALALSDGDELRWDLSEVEMSEGHDDVVGVELVDVRGPGTVGLAVATADGEVVTVEADAVESGAVETAPIVVDLPAGVDGTFLWTFSDPGTYEVDVTATGPGGDVAGGPATATLVLSVAPLVPSAPPAEPGSEAPPAAATPTGPAPEADPGASTPVGPTPQGPSAGQAPPESAPDVVAPRQARAGQQVVIDDGHVDIGPRVVDGRWRVQMKDDTVSPLVWRDLADVVLHARDASITSIPDRDAYAFLGSPGDEVYLLPQTQKSGLVWPGWNSQDPSVTAVVPGAVTWRLRSVDGPGRFVLFSTDSFGDTDVFFDSDDALPQELAIPRNSHVHGNWGFTESGVYRIGVEMVATDGDGGSLTDTRTLTVVVGDDHDPQAAFTPDPGGEGTPVDPPGGEGPADSDDPGAPEARGPGDTDASGASGGPSGAGSDSARGPRSGPSGRGLAATGASGLGPLGLTGLGLLGMGAAIVIGRRRIGASRGGSNVSAAR